MIRKIVALSFPVIVAILAATSVFAANADNSSFSIAPPPIANPVFDSKEGDMKIRGTYLTMESNPTATGTSQFKLKGYGIDIVSRKAFNSVLAIDGGIGVTYLDGNMGGGSALTGMTMPITVNLEVQPVRTDVFNLIVFAGPQFSLSYMEVDTPGMYVSIDSYVYGIQVGAQMGFNIKDTIGIDVFGMTLSQSGTQDVYTSYGDYSYDIPSYTTTTYGLDFVYLPWGVALSSILQEAGKGESNGMKTHMYQLAWSHKF
jgi:hypothetical protein